ncbi:MAG TPA: slipin family protein [Longimicrobiaceae bacterium]|nr:slipin family protein [Longimicrobiaceae bacterium]
MPGTDLTPFSKAGLPTSGPRPNILAALAFVVPAAAGVGAAAALAAATPVLAPVAAAVGVLGGFIASLSPKIAREWERAVVLRWGRYTGKPLGPGPFWVIPFVDTIPAWIDQRTITTSFSAEETLTADTVPVNVDAVLFWTVYDPEKAALEVQNYAQAVSWAAQTALRDIIGRTSLTELLKGRMRIEKELQALIDHRTTPWGVTVHSVEMRDVVIPAALQDAMSREAQAAREKQARIILGQAEVEIARLFEQASAAYRDNPTALQLRQMNILYEGLKQKGGMMVVPSSIVDSMGPAGVLAATALARTAAPQGASPPQLADGTPPPADEDERVAGVPFIAAP